MYPSPRKKYQAFLYLSERVICIILALFFILSLIPIFRIAPYNAPNSDDYWYGAESHLAFEDTGSVFEVIKTSANFTKEIYYNWQGTFFSVFMMTLQPGIWGEQFYMLTPYIMIFFMILSSLFFCYVLFKRILQMNTSQFLIITIICLFIEIQMLPGSTQGLFWYNSAIFYNFSYSIFQTLIGLLLLYASSEKRHISILVVMCIASIFVGGSNYISALLSVLLMVSAIILLAFFKNKRFKHLLIPLFFNVAAFIISVIAPGNGVRQALCTSPGVVSAIIQSFENAFIYMQEWLDIPFLIIISLCFPLLFSAAKKSTMEFKYPILVAAFSFCLFAAQFCPHLYADGTVGPTRCLNPIFFSLIFIFLINVYYLMGYAIRKFNIKDDEAPKKAGYHTVLFVGIIGLFIVVSYFLPPDMTMTRAHASLASEQAQDYGKQTEARIEMLKDETQSIVYLPPYQNPPDVLWVGDIMEDPNDIYNRNLAKFYRKEAVILKP
ncbi:MAG: hypothetical protein IJO48_06090 [Clostridia bacterium]|nr:hypothetical protein [Clostridia bacterium]